MYVLTTSCLLILLAVGTLSASTNDRPIIGILSQEPSPILTSFYGNRTSFIAASYVKYLEGAGARVVPIMVNQSESYYREIISEINGLLLPGGAAYLTEGGLYITAGNILYNLAVDLNNQGDYFPIWGTCLGFEMMLYLAAGHNDPRSFCFANNITLPLEFTDGFKQSTLFGEAPENVLTILATQNITSNFHVLCITQESLTEFGLSEDWQVLSLSKDVNGIEFISSIQSRLYPFYGSHFHPEKNVYEWKSNKNIPHSADAVRVSQYFADFFVNEARKNLHSFPSEESEESALIYQYTPIYTGDHLIYEQCYFFDN